MAAFIGRALWAALAEHPSPHLFMGLKDSESGRAVAEKRVSTLESRTRLATRCLADGGGIDAARRCSDALKILAGLTMPDVPSITERHNIVSMAGYSTDLSELSDIQLAELTIALNREEGLSGHSPHETYSDGWVRHELTFGGRWVRLGHTHHSGRQTSG